MHNMHMFNCVMLCCMCRCKYICMYVCVIKTTQTYCLIILSSPPLLLLPLLPLFLPLLPPLPFLPPPPLPSALHLLCSVYHKWQWMADTQMLRQMAAQHKYEHTHTPHATSYTLITHSVHTYVCNKQYVPVHLCSSVAVLLMEPRPPCPLLLPLLPQAVLPLPPLPPALPTKGALCTEGGLFPSLLRGGGAQGDHQAQCGVCVCLWSVGVSVVGGRVCGQ